MVSFFLALLLPAGAAVWLGAGGEVEASDGMVAVSMSCVGVSSSPGFFVGDEEGSSRWLVGGVLLAGTVLGGLAPSLE